MDAIFEYARKRVASTILVSYTLFWAIFHWQGLYATLFVDQALIHKQYGLLKNEYVNQHFFGFDWSNIFSVNNLVFLVGWLVPAFLAYAYVWWLPKWVINPAYSKEIKYKTDRKIKRIKEEKRISDQEAALIEKKIDATDKEIDLVKKQAQVAEQNPELRWEDEYDRFSSKKEALEAFDDLLTCIYEYNGSIYVDDGYENILYRLSAVARMYADTWELAKIDSGLAELTKKGRYFARLYRTNVE